MRQDTLMAQLKYEQIADWLRQRIADGTYSPGDVLPSSRDLCERWAVSRATTIKAMEMLRADGLVTPHQGRGFTVVALPLARPAGGRVAGAPRTSGALAFSRLGVPDRAKPSRRVADVLGLAPGALALRRARLMLVDGTSPHSVATAWFPLDVADACPRLAHEGPIAEGTTRYVQRVLGRAPVKGVDVTTVRLASAAEAELLGVDRPRAVAVVLHTAYDRDGRALVCEEGVTASELWERTDEYPMGDGF
jgi:GntR family transcriptional regulator